MTTKQRKRERQRLAKAAANRRNPSPNRPTAGILSGLREVSGTGVLRTQRDEITTANACEFQAGGFYYVNGTKRQFFRTITFDEDQWRDSRKFAFQPVINGLSDRT